MDFRTKQIYTSIPLVSIGMSSYNYARYINDALNSLLTQTYPFVELIIADDYSTDNSVEIIEAWVKENNIHCTFIKHEVNKGITKTLNELVTRSSGKYFVMFASDDIMLPERIERQVDILENAGEEYGMCYANPQYIDEDGNSLGCEEKSTIFTEGDALKFFIERQFGFAAPSVTIRKSVYDKIGLYNEDILIEDYNFFLRVVACYKLKYCPYPCILYRKKRESPIFNKWSDNNFDRYFFDRIISNHQAMAFIKDKVAASYLNEKISQYLKCLAVYNSPSFFKIASYLLKRGYFKIPPKFIAIKLAKMFGLMPESKIDITSIN